MGALMRFNPGTTAGLTQGWNTLWSLTAYPEQFIAGVEIRRVF